MVPPQVAYIIRGRGFLGYKKRKNISPCIGPPKADVDRAKLKVRSSISQTCNTTVI
jgi:hypothetical protein